MKHWRKGLKRIMAVALAVMMIGTTVDTSALAVLAAEEVAEVTCNHVCDEACGGMQAATEGALNGCTHVHDEECGYEEAEAECTCGTDAPAFHATNCPAYIAPENPQCFCAEKCTEDTLNIWCDVCGMQGVSACQGEDTAVAYEIEIVASDICGAEGDGSNITWTLYSDGTLTISGSGAMCDYETDFFEAPWNEHKNDITTVIIEEGVTTIGRYAFMDCRALIQITIPQSVTTIGKGAFYYCDGLTSVTLPNSISTIQEQTFYSCSSLISLTIPSGVTTIEPYAFTECYDLNSITIPEGVTTIGEMAFCDCTSLETIVIPSSVTTIGVNAFNRVPGVSPEDGFLIINGILIEYTGDAEDVEIPSGVTSINDYAFLNNNFIVTVKIPSGVTTLGNSAFSNCDSLKEITIPNGMKTIGSYAFYNCPSIAKVTIPNSVTEIGNKAFDNIAADATINAPCSWDENPLYSFADGITVNISAHQNLTYSVNDEGNVINNECSNCGKVGGTLTINAEGGIYDRTTKYGATVEKTGTLENEEVTVNYYQGVTFIGTDAPVDVGTYTAKITYKEVTVYDEFEIANGTPDIGTVSASNMENTLDVSQVVLSRSNETVTGTLSLADGTTLQYGIHDYTYVFTPNDNTNYETVTGTVSITITDTNAPTATYKVGTDGWKQFINTITFGHFCKDYTTVDITYSDEGSGVADKQYYISEEEITNTENIQWSEYTDTLNINAMGKFYIYVRVTDNYGNVVIQNSEGIVVYAESVIAPTSFSCEYGEENALYVDIFTNGNTFANLTDGSGNEIDTENYSYSIDERILTIKGEYLSDLDVGTYTYKICMNPQGVENTEVTLAYSFVVKVSAKELTVTGATATSRDYIANDKTVDITGVTLSGKQETDDVSVEITGLKGTLSSANAGTYTSVTLPTLTLPTFTLTGDDAENYVLVQPTSAVATNVTINKLNPTITVGETEYYKTFGDADFTLDITDDNLEANVTYSSNDENVVAVSNGTVTIKGVGSATITVSMGASTNYNAAVDKTVTVNVARAAYSVDTINKNYLYARSNADSINLAELLPEDCGTVNYASVTYNGALTFTSEDTKPKVTNGILAYTLESGADDDTGNIIVDVETQNYEDITITVNVTLTDQIPVNVDGEVELNSNVLTYGETLSGLTFKSVDFVDNAGNEVEGTLAWKEPSATPNAGTTSATWV
ncbi:MAG: leucine-rich repeat protein, partial [Lachnospiraceae bacterium]|nr:leucine-rich repeat protein [Lachnospiraceae bacterium]